MWSGIIVTLLYSIFGIELNTKDRFTGTEGRALERKTDEIAIDLERIEKQNAAFFVKELQVRKQHDLLEQLTRDILQQQRNHHLREHK